MAKIAIIGSGISGLTAANLLKGYADITIFEKSRSVSGRMSTRRAEPYFFDHGAQYFTARTEPFKRFISPLINSGLIERWEARYVKFDGNIIIERKDWAEVDSEPRYVGVPSMNIIAKHLSANLDIKLNTRIITLKQTGKWQLLDDKSQSYGNFDCVISTAPAPQTADLFPKNFQYHNNIRNVQMTACFSLMLGFSDPLDLDFDAAHIINSDLSWLAVNSHKPGRTKPYTLLVNSSDVYAEAHLNDDRSEILKHLCFETSRIIGRDVSIAEHKTVHSWLYANNVKREKGPVFFDQRLLLGACGDWCVGGRVEGAFTAAHDLIKKVKDSNL